MLTSINLTWDSACLELLLLPFSQVLVRVQQIRLESEEPKTTVGLCRMLVEGKPSNNFAYQPTSRSEVKRNTSSDHKNEQATSI